MKTVGPPYSGKLNVRWDEKGMIGQRPNHSFTLEQINAIKHNQVEQHCQQLIIQMNALIKNISVELLHFSKEDFERLQLAALGKYSELIANDKTKWKKN
jgi:hypothetical protein